MVSQLNLFGQGWVPSWQEKPKEGQTICCIRLMDDGSYLVNTRIFEFDSEKEAYLRQMMYWTPVDLPPIPKPLPNDEWEFE